MQTDDLVKSAENMDFILLSIKIKFIADPSKIGSIHR